MKLETGIILTGGTGSRLAPLNSLFNKHLIPVYNKFIVDYPLETLKNIGIKKLTVVLGGLHFSQIVSHIKDGNHLGMFVNYVYQDKPAGIAQAINLCKNIVKDDKFVVILGDNIYENEINFIDNDSAQIVLHKHPELYRFGVASYLEDKLVSIVEKPKLIDDCYDNYAITGCYLFDQDFFKYFDLLSPSARGEYEIVDIIKLYAESDKLGRIFVNGLWSDTGTHQSINYVNNFFYKKFFKSSRD
jgi:glucose-1-phosphate thymidylyltransferase